MPDENTTSSSSPTASGTLKERFPFRLGTTSYIIPADILPNVHYLADKVDDIELVLFESDEISNIPDESIVRQLRSFAESHRLTYTVHLPLDAHLGSTDESVRRSSLNKCRRIIDRMDAADPFCYVIHFHGDMRGSTPSADMPRWLNQHRRSLNELLAYTSPQRLAVETLDYPYACIESLVREYDLATCLDIGHVWMCGYSLPYYIDRYLPRTRVIHLHGICDGRDHTSLSHIDPNTLKSVMQTLLATSHDTQRVLTLEVFSEPDFLTSLDTLRPWIP